MFKIYYYSPVVRMPQDEMMIAIPPLYLNGYLKVDEPELYDKVTWQKFQFFELDQAALIEDLNRLESDILCISIYIWNMWPFKDLLRNIKKGIKKDIKIIMGGPNVDSKNKSFLDDYPDVDFAVYAQGEKPFADILKHLLGIKKLNLIDSRNTFWRDDAGNIKKADFEFFRLDARSPYLLSYDLLEQILSTPEYKDINFSLPYETSKGCPYDCSFCDWTSGLTNKTYHRKFDIREELRVLGSLGLTKLRMADANFGQHKQDVDIVKIMAELKKEFGYDFKIYNVNFSKLKKDRVFEIVELLIENNLLDDWEGDTARWLTFAVQDTHEYILKNIERPDIPWPEHKAYIDGIRKKYPDQKITIELIQGLPGQTRESWEQSLIDLQPYNSYVHIWTILPNSPAGYNQEYRSKMQLDIRPLRFFTWGNYTVNTVVGTYSYNTDDYAYFTLLSKIASTRYTQLRKYINLQDLFKYVKNSRHLNRTLEELKNSILNDENSVGIDNSVIKFLANLCKEFDKELSVPVKETIILILKRRVSSVKNDINNRKSIESD